MRYKHIATIGAILISIFVLLAALMYYFNQDSCPVGTFLCQNSTLCMPQRSWCNGILDCPDGDDESIECFDSNGDWNWYRKARYRNTSTFICPHVTKDDPGYYKNCDYVNCTVRCIQFQENKIPQTFSKSLTTMTFTNSSFNILRKNDFMRYSKLRSLFLTNNSIQVLEDSIFAKQKELTWLILSNNKIEEILKGHLIGLSSLETLSLDNNKIRTLNLQDLENSTTFELLDLSKNFITSSKISLPYLPGLRELILDENRLKWISNDTFSRLPMLSSLTLESNLIRNISRFAFKNLIQLKDLNLMYNQITTIPNDLFNSVGSLSVLLLGCNPIENLSAVSLSPLKKNLKSLGVEGIEMDNIEKNLFNIFTKLQFVYFKKFHYCTTYAPNVKVCSPTTDGVSSLSHLLGKPLLRVAVWGISCLTCLGNILVLWGRVTSKDENRVLSIVIRNLAVADLLMGFYLLTIGLEDMRFRNNYNQEANAWISSWSCTLLGMLAMTSSEVSVLILSFMSVERFMLIAAPLKGHRAITPQTAAAAMILVWLVGITLALVPAIHWRSSTRFYGLNGMCFPLHIDDPFLVGWEYSAFIFLGVNLLGLVTIGYAYTGMFVSIWRTRHATPLSVGDSEFALRFFLIVLTDSVCWAPIIILKILALAKYPVAPDLHAWVVIFILPVNSAVNPLLYTFTTPKFRERLSQGWFRRVRNIASRKQSRTDSQTSSSYNNKNVTTSMPSSMKTSSEEQILKPSLNEMLLINIMSKEK